jgi:hypothetical protein
MVAMPRVKGARIEKGFIGTSKSWFELREMDEEAPSLISGGRRGQVALMGNGEQRSDEGQSSLPTTRG